MGQGTTNQYTSIANVLGNIIQKNREKKKIGQEELARKMNINRVTMSKIENGESEISISILVKLNEEFGVNLMQQLDEEKELLEKAGFKVYSSNKDLPGSKKNDSKTGKFIAGAIALAAIIAYLNRTK